MARDDYFVIAAKILDYLYKCEWFYSYIWVY